MFRWHFKFQRCSSDGGYWGNDGWFNISVIAPNYSEALKKAMEVTQCKYVRGIECSAEEIQEDEDGK